MLFQVASLTVTHMIFLSEAKGIVTSTYTGSLCETQPAAFNYTYSFPSGFRVDTHVSGSEAFDTCEYWGAEDNENSLSYMNYTIQSQSWDASGWKQQPFCADKPHITKKYEDGVCIGTTKTEIDKDTRDCTIVESQYKNADCSFPSGSNAATYFELDLERCQSFFFSPGAYGQMGSMTASKLLKVDDLHYVMQNFADPFCMNKVSERDIKIGACVEQERSIAPFRIWSSTMEIRCTNTRNSSIIDKKKNRKLSTLTNIFKDAIRKHQ